jgi:hypothetical protein
MNRKDWRRHERHKARRFGAAQRPLDLSSSVATYPFDQAELRIAEIDTTEPLPDVVRHVAARLIAGTSSLTVIRVLTFRNWDEDDRHLIEIPEAREFCKNLWMNGKQLLRLLIESTHDTPADDRPGVTQKELIGMGLGWWEVYCIAASKLEWLVPDWSMQKTDATFIHVAARDDARRKAHEELFAGIDRGPLGYTPEAAAERARLIDSLSEPIQALVIARDEGHFAGDTVLILSLADEKAGAIATQLKSSDPGGKIPWMTVSWTDKPGCELCLLPGGQAAAAIVDCAPNVAAAVRTEKLLSDEYWVIVVASGGTQSSKVRH